MFLLRMMTFLSNLNLRLPTKVFLIIPFRFLRSKDKALFKVKLVHRFNYGALVYDVLERHRRASRYTHRNMGPVMAKKIDEMPYEVIKKAHEAFMYQVQNHNTPHPNYFIKVCENLNSKFKPASGRTGKEYKVL